MVIIDDYGEIFVVLFSGDKIMINWWKDERFIPVSTFAFASNNARTMAAQKGGSF